MSDTYYIMKVKGIDKIPDYIQLRDENFTLVGYFRPSRPQRALKRMEIEDKEEKLKAIIDDLSYGQIEKISL